MPTLILICGLPGEGKTTLARQLEQSRQAIRLCPDEWIGPLLADADDTIERDRLRDPIESLQWELARRLLALGTTVILENGFWSKAERTRYRDAARAMGARVERYFQDVPQDELWRRIEQRNAHLPDGSFAITRAELDSWLPFFEPPDADEWVGYDKPINAKDGECSCP